ncbi:MAG: glutamate--tRNA ligase [Thermaurantimonas sp.]
MRRVRFAPSPTGPLHMGGVRTALYNYLFAKQVGGKFILRIEDTDQSRTVPYAETYIFETLKWLNIIPDEGFSDAERNQYKQSNRKEIYKRYVNQLVESGAAYLAFDTQEELDKTRNTFSQSGKAWQYDSITRQYMRNSLSLSSEEVQKLLDNNTPFVVRLKFDRNQEIKFHDLIRGTVAFNTNNLDDKILFKSDGMPTYHLANVVDDYLMGITHVIRGEEWLPSTPVHVMLYKQLGIEDKMPEFAHLPLLLKPDGNGKLSKRDGEKYGFPVFPLKFTSEEQREIEGYREIGFLPEAFLNMLSLLGWNPGTDQEIFTLQELIDLFAINKISKSGAKFSYQKALWINHIHIKNASVDYLLKYITETFKEKSFNLQLLEKVIEVDKQRVNLLTDIIEDYNHSEQYEDYCDYNFLEEQLKKADLNVINNLVTFLENISFTDSEEIDRQFKTFLESNNVKIGKIGLSIRALLFGKKTGPTITEILYILGKEETIRRLKRAFNGI